MNKNLKNIIFIVIVCIIILITIIIGLKIVINKNNPERIKLNEMQRIKEEHYDNPVYIHHGQKPEKVKNASVFYTVDACVQKYLGFLATKNDNAIKSVQDNNLQEVNIDNYNEQLEYETRLVYVLSGEKFVTYYVQGNISNNDVYFILNTDISNKSFYIASISSDNYNNKINEEVNEDIKTENIIELNEYNQIVNVTMNDEKICDKYLKYYNNLLLKNPEKAYQLLDDDYKNKRFSDIDEFKNYIKERELAIKKCYLDEYTVELKDNKTVYIIKDTYNYYYEIAAESVMEFKIKMDEYTILSDEFNNKYKELSSKDKASTNVAIFMQMINNKDYKHIYEKLDKEFKNNNFKTEEEFEEYCKSNFFVVNDYNIDESNVEGEIYSYSIYISNSIAIRDKATKNLTIVMQLKEGTDYVMSFSM